MMVTRLGNSRHVYPGGDTSLVRRGGRCGGCGGQWYDIVYLVWLWSIVIPLPATTPLFTRGLL